MAQSHLRKVKRLRERAQVTEREFRRAIVDAHESGETFRDIANWAGLSHQRVHEIVRSWRE